MKIGELISKTVDMISRNPSVLLLYIVPALLVLLGGILNADISGGFGEEFQRELQSDPARALELLGRAVPGMASASLSRLFGLFGWIASWVAGAATVALVDADISGNKITIVEALGKVSGKLIIFFLVSILAFVIYIVLGILALCVGLLFFLPFLLFVWPALIIDDLGFGAISKSYEIAKINYPVALFSCILLGVCLFIVGAIPYLGGALDEFIVCIGVVAFTILYIEYTRAPSASS